MYCHINKKFTFDLFAIVLLLFYYQDLLSFKFYSPAKTLEVIYKVISNKEKGIFLRFGDGDLNLAYFLNAGWQHKNPLLRLEMLEALKLNGKNIFKTLPILSKVHKTIGPEEEENIKIVNYKLSEENANKYLEMAQKVWGGPITKVYSPYLGVLATSNPEPLLDFLVKLRKQQCILVGNKNIYPHIKTLLFGEKAKFVETEPRDAYNSINDTEQEVLRVVSLIKGYKVIVTSMGPAGRVLQKRLYSKVEDVFFFDLGSLTDALCDFNTRSWMSNTVLQKRIKLFKSKLVNMVNASNTINQLSKE